VFSSEPGLVTSTQIFLLHCSGNVALEISRVGFLQVLYPSCGPIINRTPEGIQATNPNHWLGLVLSGLLVEGVLLPLCWLTMALPKIIEY